MGVNVVKLGDYIKIQTGKLDANASDANGIYPFFTCAVEPLQINTYAYDCECILVAGNGDLNVKYYNGKFNAYQRTYIIEIKNKELDIRYLYHFLTKYINILRKNSIGGVIKYIKLGDLTDIKLPLPSIDKQQKIVSILDKADEIRTKKKQANEKLDDFLKSTYINLFAENSKRVKLEKLGYFITKGTTPKAQDMSQDSGDIPYIKVYNLRFDTRLDFTVNPTFVTQESHKNFLARSIVYPGDVLMNIVGPPLCKVSIVPDTYSEWNINQAIARFRCNKELNNLYLAWFLTTPFAEKQMLRNAKKTSGQLNLTLEICKNIEIPLPSIELQNKFAQIVEKVEEQKTKNEKVIKQMDNLFNSLSQKAFKGEL